MALTLITDWAKQEEIRALSPSFKNQFDQLSKEVETVNLKKLLGIEFYNDVIANIASENEKYTTLLDGCSFEMYNYTYNHVGLRAFIAHLNAAEFQIRGAFHQTASGIITKTNQDYQQPSLSALKQLKTELTEYAFTFWTEINRFLLNDSSNYPLYLINSRQTEVYQNIITKIG